VEGAAPARSGGVPWTPPSAYPNLAGYRGPLIVDVETCDLNLKSRGAGWVRRDGHVVGVALGTLDREWYFPVGHEGGGNLTRQSLDFALDAIVAHHGPLVAFNGIYDAGWMSTLHPQLIERWRTAEDVLYGAVLLDETQQQYSLDAVAKRRGLRGKDEALLVEGCVSLGIAKPKKRQLKDSLWRMHSRYVGPYAEADVVATRELWLAQAPELEREGLLDVYRLECRLSAILVRMRARGVRVNEAAAEQAWERLMAREVSLQDQILREHGVAIAGPRDAASIGAACDRLGIEYQRTVKKGEPSFTDDWMEHHPHPLFALLREYRGANTLRTLAVEGIVLDHVHRGRVHPELHPLRRPDDEQGARTAGGAVSGRFSCSKPNLLQAPVRTGEGAALRALFLPEEGQQVASLDYNQQEQRLMVHYALLLGLPGSREVAEQYSKHGADFHQIIADRIGRPRKIAKPINLGLAYEMGRDKLRRKLGMTAAETDATLAHYHATVPFMKGLSRQAADVASSRGYVRTILGRRRHFDEWEPVEYVRRGQKRSPAYPRAEAEAAYPGRTLRRAYTYRGLNAIIQGSAADQTKAAVVDLDDAGATESLMLIVHDELLLSVPQGDPGAAEVEHAAATMRGAIELLLPTVVDCGTGGNWKEAKA